MATSLQHMVQDGAAVAESAAVPGRLTLARINQRLHRVLAPGGDHVGNLQYSGGQWKFKAVGYDRVGAVLPGWGPLTDCHNTVFAEPDEALLNAAFEAFALLPAA
jgi:hypothetical protein